MTSPPRTTVDAAAWLDADNLESMIEQGIRRRYFPEDGFVVEVDHLSWRGARLEGGYDRRRDLKVRAGTGFYVERVTDIAIGRYLDEAIGDLLAVCNRVRATP